MMDRRFQKRREFSRIAAIAALACRSSTIRAGPRQRIAGVRILIAEIDRISQPTIVGSVSRHLVGKFQRPNMLSVSSAPAPLASAWQFASFWILIDPSAANRPMNVEMDKSAFSWSPKFLRLELSDHWLEGARAVLATLLARPTSPSMVMLGLKCHVERAISGRRLAFSPAPVAKPRTCLFRARARATSDWSQLGQIAIIATKSVIDARARLFTNVFNIYAS